MAAVKSVQKEDELQNTDEICNDLQYVYPRDIQTHFSFVFLQFGTVEKTQKKRISSLSTKFRPVENVLCNTSIFKK